MLPRLVGQLNTDESADSHSPPTAIKTYVHTAALAAGSASGGANYSAPSLMQQALWHCASQTELRRSMALTFRQSLCYSGPRNALAHPLLPLVINNLYLAIAGRCAVLATCSVAGTHKQSARLLASPVPANSSKSLLPIRFPQTAAPLADVGMSRHVQEP